MSDFFDRAQKFFNYDNIGRKIKKMAKVFAIIEAVLFAIGGLWLMYLGLFDYGIEDGGFAMFLAGAMVIVGGAFIAWVSTWMVYGFGEIIDKLTAIENNTKKQEEKVEED